jgi:hypothetical protein
MRCVCGTANPFDPIERPPIAMTTPRTRQHSLRYLGAALDLPLESCQLDVGTGVIDRDLHNVADD